MNKNTNEEKLEKNEKAEKQEKRTVFTVYKIYAFFDIGRRYSAGVRRDLVRLDGLAALVARLPDQRDLVRDLEFYVQP